MEEQDGYRPGVAVLEVDAEVAAGAADRAGRPPLDERRPLDGVDARVRRRDEGPGLRAGLAPGSDLEPVGEVIEPVEVHAPHVAR